MKWKVFAKFPDPSFGTGPSSKLTILTTLFHKGHLQIKLTRKGGELPIGEITTQAYIVKLAQRWVKNPVNVVYEWHLINFSP